FKHRVKGHKREAQRGQHGHHLEVAVHEPLRTPTVVALLKRGLLGLWLESFYLAHVETDHRRLFGGLRILTSLRTKVPKIPVFCEPAMRLHPSAQGRGIGLLPKAEEEHQIKLAHAAYRRMYQPNGGGRRGGGPKWEGADTLALSMCPPIPGPRQVK